MTVRELHAEPLTRQVFAPFGDVIQTDGAKSHFINEGTTERFHDLAAIDVDQAGGRPLVNIFCGQPRRFPYRIKLMERHPLASQAFIPLQRQSYLVVVAAGAATPTVDNLRAFVANGDQGVNYHRGVWHHPLLGLERTSEFLVIDRGGEGDNLEEIELDPGCDLILGELSEC